ncbi:hypothetical protein RintRC_6153 [Richelia intracellularis]|nr:hypothetical protein RintRC_6153 [Richelia intracellularis]
MPIPLFDLSNMFLKLFTTVLPVVLLSLKIKYSLDADFY